MDNYDLEKGMIFYGRANEWRYIPGEFFKILDITDDQATLVQLDHVVKGKQGSYSRYRGLYDYEMYPQERKEVGNPFKVEFDIEDERCPFKGDFPFDIDVEFIYNGDPISWTEDTTD